MNEATLLYRQERPLAATIHRLVVAFPPTAEQEGRRQPTSRSGSFPADAVSSTPSAAPERPEIPYEGILAALQAGSRVCIAIPRRDVVRELAERLKPIFPDTVVKALFQGSKDDAGAHLLVSTIHQLIHFHQEFDLLVIDEADAFPYRGDAFLHALVKKAMKPDAALVEMSATPEKASTRHLLSPRPLPSSKARRPSGRIRRWSFWRRFMAELIPLAVAAWLRPEHEAAEGDAVRPGHRLWPDAFGPARISWECGPRTSRARNKEHSMRIRAFREGRVDVIVATTLLERGVTFRGTDVAVFAAEREVFSTNVLIQIAGRVGRAP
ncbi:MAG: hypothetical protein MZU97_06980 [Bacillus subtilis]|nr:hypothetical protein [Bacillus subtilis]